MRQISNVRRSSSPVRIAWRQAADQVLIAGIFGGTAGTHANVEPREARRISSSSQTVAADVREPATAH